MVGLMPCRGAEESFATQSRAYYVPDLDLHIGHLKVLHEQQSGLHI